jgi:hypothetical protein
LASPFSADAVERDDQEYRGQGGLRHCAIASARKEQRWIEALVARDFRGAVGFGGGGVSGRLRLDHAADSKQDVDGNEAPKTLNVWQPSVSRLTISR